MQRHQIQRLRDRQVCLQGQRFRRHIVADPLLRHIVDDPRDPVENIPLREDADQPVLLVGHQHAANVVPVHLPDRARQRAALAHRDRHIRLQRGQRARHQQVLKLRQGLCRLLHLIDILFVQPRDRHLVEIGGDRRDLPLLGLLSLLHRPQVRRQVELVQVARAPLRLRRLHLRHHLAPVIRLAHVADHTHRRRIVGKLHAAQNRRQRPRRGIVNQDLIQIHLVQRYDLRRKAIQPDPLVPVLPEDHMLAVLEVEDRVVAIPAVAQLRPLVRVEDHAVLIDLQEGGPLVFGGPFQDRGQVLRMRIDRARHKGRLRGQRNRNRVQRLLHRAHRRRLRHRPRPRRGRILTFRQSVYPVVEENDVQIHIAPDRMKQMVAADRKAVPVPGDHPDTQLRVGNRQTRRQRRRPPVNAVDPIRVHVVGEAARAADARNKDRFLLRHPRLRQDALHLRQDRVVAAAGAPAHRLIRYEILTRQRDFLCRCCAHLCSPQS